MLDPDTPEAGSPAMLAERLAARLAATIAARRSALGLTQAELAERLDIATKTVSGFERAKHLPSLVTLVRMAQVLRVSVGELLGERPAASDEAVIQDPGEAGLITFGAVREGPGCPDATSTSSTDNYPGTDSRPPIATGLARKGRHSLNR